MCASMVVFVGGGRDSYRLHRGSGGSGTGHF